MTGRDTGTEHAAIKRVKSCTKKGLIRNTENGEENNLARC